MIGPGTLSALLASLTAAQGATFECRAILDRSKQSIDPHRYAVAKMHIEIAEESLYHFRKQIGIITSGEKDEQV